MILKITYIAIVILLAIEFLTLLIYLRFHTCSLQRQAAKDERDGLSQPLAAGSTANLNTPGGEVRSEVREKKVLVQGARAHAVLLGILDVLLL